MKIFIGTLIIVLVSASVILNTTSVYAQKSNNALKQDELALYSAALLLLRDDDYQILENYQKTKNVGAVAIILDEQLADIFPSVDKKEMRKMRASSMFSYGASPAFPIYIRKDSNFYKTVVEGFVRTRHLVPAKDNPAVMAYAAKISHEIFHINNPLLIEDENSAIQHEEKMFNGYLNQSASALNVTSLRTIAENYLSILKKERK